MTEAFGEESLLAKPLRLMIGKNWKLDYPGLKNLKFQIFEIVVLASLAVGGLIVALVA